MPESISDHYRRLKRNAKSEGIQISHTKYACTANVDIHLKGHFNTILALGRMSFSEYAPSEDLGNSSTEWQTKNKYKALRLTNLAAICRRERQNEGGWRMAIEPVVFSRFGLEVSCKTCKGRTWRSEIEAEPTSSNGRITSLRARQKKRYACTCASERWKDECDSSDPRLSNLFSTRIDTPCHAPNPAGFDPKKRPDRIHGLRRTKNIDILLQSQCWHDGPSRYEKIVGEVIRPISLQREDEGLLYPFLIMEAKSERASSFEQIEIQTCFPVKQALELQQRLFKVRRDAMDMPGGPLVWFIANHGEDWRVYSAHIEGTEAQSKYIINHLWSGCITGRDEALQLILIVDHIVDWARDIFRPNISRKLRSLTSGDFNDQTTIDSDVVSLRRHPSYVANWARGQARGGASLAERIAVPRPPMHRKFSITQDTVDQLSSKHGLVKDAKRIDSRLKGLLITQDSLENILLGYNDLEDRKEFLDQVIALLDSRGVTLKDRDALDRVEDFWTGNSCGRSKSPHISESISDHKIYAHFQISYYIDSSWNQVRELAYLAVQADAIELPMLRAAFDTRNSKKSFPPQEIDVARLVSGLYDMQDRSVRQDTVSALCRRTYFMTFGKPRSADLHTSRSFVVDIEGLVQEITGPLPVTFEQDRFSNSLGNKMLELVDKTFENLLKVSRGSTESFLRQASRIDIETRPLWRGWTPGACLQQKDSHLGKILVHSIRSPMETPSDSSDQNYCLYIMDDQHDAMDQYLLAIRAKLRNAMKEEELYSTMRGARVPYAGSDQLWRDNRVRYWFSLKNPDSRERIMINMTEFKAEMGHWRRAILGARSSSSHEDVVILGSKRRVTADAMPRPNSSAVRCAAA